MTWNSFWEWLDIQLGFAQPPVVETPTPVTIPVMEPSKVAPTTENPDTMLPWEFGVLGSANNIHNVRVRCDLKGLNWNQKESLTACVKVESDFDTNAIHKNFVMEQQKDAEGNVIQVKVLASTDSGICQWNDKYHGTEISSVQALTDPTFSVDLMCDYWLAGKMSQWVSYSSGEYLQYLGKV